MQEKWNNYFLHHHLLVVEGKGGELPTIIIFLLQMASPSLSSHYRKAKDLHSLKSSSFCSKRRGPPFHIVILLLLQGTRTLKGKELPHLHHLLFVKRWSHHLFSFFLFVVFNATTLYFFLYFFMLFYLWLFFFLMYIYTLSYFMCIFVEMNFFIVYMQSKQKFIY